MGLVEVKELRAAAAKGLDASAAKLTAYTAALGQPIASGVQKHVLAVLDTAKTKGTTTALRGAKAQAESYAIAQTKALVSQ